MAGISSRALSFGKDNHYKFNGANELEEKNFSDGSGLQWYDATHRGYDPQIGRFFQPDPFAHIFSETAPYAFANNNPVLLNDPLGLMSDSAHPVHLQDIVIVGKRKGPKVLTILNQPGMSMKPNPDMKDFGTSKYRPYILYRQTPPDQWDPKKTAELTTAIQIGAALIPVADGVE